MVEARSFMSSRQLRLPNRSGSIKGKIAEEERSATVFLVSSLNKNGTVISHRSDEVLPDFILQRL